MRTVLVYANSLLPWSETFIREQLLTLRRWHGLLVGLRDLRQLPLDDLETCILRAAKPGISERLQWKLAGYFGTVPRQAIERLGRQSPSLLHAHFGIDAVKAWPIARALGIPMLVTLHGYDINTKRDWWEAGHGGVAMRGYPSQLLTLAKDPRVHFIAVSEAIRSQAISFGIADDKITVSYIGVDTSKFVPGARPVTEREKRVLFVGRLVEKKGCECLIRAFAKVQKAIPDSLLIIVGDGPLRSSLQQLASVLQIRVEFHGTRSGADLREEFDSARVFCLPSIIAANGDAEGFGIVLLESQASGVPVVTSALGGAAEGIVDGSTGYAFAPGDVDTLAAHLARLLTEDTLATAFAAAGPQFVAEKFDLLRCTEKLEAIYDALTCDNIAPA
jgi:glycosyltransferase involved in cell wall biosynthesis